MQNFSLMNAAKPPSTLDTIPPLTSYGWQSAPDARACVLEPVIVHDEQDYISVSYLLFPKMTFP